MSRYIQLAWVRGCVCWNDTARSSAPTKQGQVVHPYPCQDGSIVTPAAFKLFALHQCATYSNGALFSIFLLVCEFLPRFKGTGGRCKYISKNLLPKYLPIFSPFVREIIDETWKQRGNRIIQMFHDDGGSNKCKGLHLAVISLNQWTPAFKQC